MDQQMFNYADNKYRATIIRWIDGDTVVLDVDLGQKVHVRGNYRLNRIDAPETSLRKGVTPEEKQAGKDLTAQLNLEYPIGMGIAIATSKEGKYGRWLVEIWVPKWGTDEWINLNDKMLAEGLVKPYGG